MMSLTLSLILLTKTFNFQLRCFGHHLKGGSDGKWVTYKDYNYNFSCFSDDLRVAANPYNVTHAYSNM